MEYVEKQICNRFQAEEEIPKDNNDEKKITEKNMSNQNS